SRLSWGRRKTKEGLAVAWPVGWPAACWAFGCRIFRRSVAKTKSGIKFPGTGTLARPPGDLIARSAQGTQRRSKQLARSRDRRPPRVSIFLVRGAYRGAAGLPEESRAFLRARSKARSRATRRAAGHECQFPLQRWHRPAAKSSS